MNITSRRSQRGIAHLVLIIIIFAVLGLIGFAGYKVVSGKDGEKAADSIARKAAEAACTETDKNICKFQSSWKEQKYYTLKSKTTADGQTSESTYQAEGDKRFHMTLSGEMAYEIIVIDNDTYTKAANGTWWKQTNKPEEASKYAQDFDFDDNDSDSSSEEPKNTTTYKNLGKEACGNLTCFKYQVVDSSAPNDKEYIWFDTKDYQLRRTLSESSDGTVSDSTFSYEKISIKVPSPVKELGPNQYLMPGASEPTTLPDAGSAQDYLNSLPQYSGEDGSAEQ
jgi:Tfp pilus assembly protein PilX